MRLAPCLLGGTGGEWRLTTPVQAPEPFVEATPLRPCLYKSTSPLDRSGSSILNLCLVVLAAALCDSFFALRTAGRWILTTPVRPPKRIPSDTPTSLSRLRVWVCKLTASKITYLWEGPPRIVGSGTFVEARETPSPRTLQSISPLDLDASSIQMCVMQSVLELCATRSLL